MKVNYLKVSNILSFKHYQDIEHCDPILFNIGLNIIIGENGSGKSTALEVINFIFKRVLYKPCSVNYDLIDKRSSISSAEAKQILTIPNNRSYREFRLEPNWSSESKKQTIRLQIELDDVDKANIKLIKDSMTTLSKSVGRYTNEGLNTSDIQNDTYQIDVILNNETKEFVVNSNVESRDFGFEYLTKYNFYKELINVHNSLNPENPIANMHESFTLISGYRNYNAFSNSVSLRDKHASVQIEDIKNIDSSRSLNVSENSEPSIFNIVRLRVAEKHFELDFHSSSKESERAANELTFIKSINEKLELINLKCRIKVLDKRTWDYSFEFYDIKRNRLLDNINSLSAGQKSILHLIFEAYGRGKVKGGLVIIDEPEIHLHYQFQNEYLEVIKDLKMEYDCQYIIVTHSDALINSETIKYVKRFSLNEEGETKVSAPELTTSQKTQIKILDNTRSTFAFFSKKVLLVEGDSDRYFFRTVLKKLYPREERDIAVLYIGGKDAYKKWKELFSKFDLPVYFIGDFDNTIPFFYPSNRGISLKSRESVKAFKNNNPDWEKNIESKYSDNVYILKEGDLETYLSISKKNLDNVIEFCDKKMDAFFEDEENKLADEVKKILRDVTS